MPRFRPLKRLPDLKGKLPEDLFEKDVLQEFRSPMLDQGDLDDEEICGTEVSLWKRSREGSWESRACQESGVRRSKLRMLRKCDFPTQNGLSERLPFLPFRRER